MASPGLPSNSHRHCSCWWVLLLLGNKFGMGSGSSWYAHDTELRVHLPISLRLADGASYDHREAKFGETPIGGSLTAPLYYADSTLCNEKMDFTTIDERISFHPSSPLLSSQSNGRMPFILMVNRGDCHFVQKVRNAQHLGASGVLIADTKCLCIDQHCHSELGMSCEDSEPTMSDDGSGSDITIPSFMLFKHDADVFKKQIMESNQTMRVEMSFPTNQVNKKKERPHKQHSESESPTKISMDLWMTPTDYYSLNFLKEFHPMVDALNSCIKFTPHMYLVDGVKSGCMEKSNTPDDSSQEQRNLPCYNLCTNGGRYCAGDPDGKFDSGVSGADVVAESLRQLCIWSYFVESMENDNTDESPMSNQRNSWWDYVRVYSEKCPNLSENGEYNSCVDEVLSTVGIDKDLVENCMSDAGGLSIDNKNRNNKLENELALQKRENIYVVPTIRLNGRSYDGGLDELFIDLCHSCHYDHEKAGVCHSCRSCPNVSDCVARGGKCSTMLSEPVLASHQVMWYDRHPEKKIKKNSFGDTDLEGGGVSVTTLLSSVVCVTTIMFLASFWYYKQTARKTREQIRAIVADYMLLSEEAPPQTVEEGGHGTVIQIS